jgi:hypothetical protein
MIPQLPGAEPRLQGRYHRLVIGHLSSAQRVAAGLRLPPDTTKPFAATQAAWRFYANPNVTLPELSGPLVACARAGVTDGCDQHVLIALDWSLLHFSGHPSKTNRVELIHRQDLGYDLLTALALSDRDGAPLAPVVLDLRAADGVHSTRCETPLAIAAATADADTSVHLDALEPVMGHVSKLALGKTPVFIIDREADSVGHYRLWDKAGRRFVVRANNAPRVLHEGVHRPLAQVADLLKSRRKGDAFTRDQQTVLFEGRPAVQFVAETSVVLQRPARTHRVDKRTGEPKHRNVAGAALPLRLIVTEVRDDQGKVLARWLLLSNLPSSVSAATIARWYYWRWRIESYHKLLKGAGQQLEQWQQESPAALARRLAVAAMACVVVWRLARDDRPEAEEMRQVLVRLSGRQMRRGGGDAARGFTEPALLAGLSVLIPMLLLLEQHDLQDIRRLAAATLPNLTPTPPVKRSPPTRHRKRKVV